MITKSSTTGDYVLRISDGAIIDRPYDLTVVRTTKSVTLTQWVVSWYPDSAEADGYQSCVWQASQPRGFLIPNHSATGDIVEFGLAYQLADGSIEQSTVSRWYGWLNYGTARAMVFKGRYAAREVAAEQAAVVIDLVRMNAIDPDKSFDVGQIDPTVDSE